VFVNKAEEIKEGVALEKNGVKITALWMLTTAA
jgi:hypothetical protein